MVGNKRNTPWYGWISLVMFCAGIIFMFYNLIIRAPKAKLVEEQLSTEFNLIRPFPRAVAIHSEKSSKDAKALVLTRYSTDATYEEIQAYYNTEFGQPRLEVHFREAAHKLGTRLGKNLSLLQRSMVG